MGLGLGLLFCPAANALTVSASPTTCASIAGVGTVGWSNPTRAISSNNSFATAAVDGTTTRYLRCTGYNFAIPAGATINGITVSVERRSSRITDGGSKDAAMRVVKAGVIGATDRSTTTTYTTADVIEAHGGAADLWGDTWTPAQINAATFGAAFAATKANPAGIAHTISVDHIRITIDYSFAPGAYTQTANPTACASIAGVGTVAWTNPTRAFASDNSYATAAVDGTTTRYLRCLGYNFTIPAGAIINGITVNVERRSNRVTDGGSKDAEMRLVKAGAIDLTVNRATTTIYTTSDVAEAHGGVSDLWGTTWTVAEINAANFGAAFAATKTNPAGPPHAISVDHMPITVSYTIPAQLDHIRIEHDGLGLTCTPETVTVKACADASCSTLYAGPTAVALSPAGWTSTPITFTGSTTASLAITAPSTVTLGTSAVNPPPANGTQCYIGAIANCSLVFADTGFIFSAIPNQTAGVTSGSLTIQAVKKADNSTACTGVFTGNVTLDMASQCVNPTTCNGRQVTINSTAIINHPASGIASYTPVTLNFGGSSTASFTLNYPDVGNMSLSARYALGSNFMTGTSNTFVVKPFGFSVTNIQTTTGATPNPAAGSAAGPKFIHAGEAFTATVTAITQSGAAAPNFGRETLAEGVLLTPNIVLPAGGAVPALSNGSIAGGSFSNGVATRTDLAWGEVGIITLTPGIADGDYLEAGNATGATTGNIGRFVPHHFTAVGEVISACVSGGFSYMAQNFTLARTGNPLSGEMLEARNLGDVLTTNYTGTFALGSASFGLENNDDGADLAARLSAPGAWLNGVYTLTSTNAVFSRPASVVPDTSWGAFDQLDIGMTVVDADVATVPRVSGADMSLAAGPCGGACTHKKITAAGGTKMRYGRVRLNNANGSELLALPVPVKAQYYNGFGFVSNSLDSCTTFTIPVSGSPCAPLSCVWGDLTLTRVTLNADTTNVTITNNPLLSGASQFNLSAPAGAARGAVDLMLNVPAWLEYNWTGAVGDPTSRATFGAYRKSDQFIYQRENY